MLCGLSSRLAGAVVFVGISVAAATSASAITLNQNGITLNADPFERSQLAQAQTAMAQYQATHTISNLRVETFEGYNPWGVGGGTQDLTHTNVGSFTPFGTTGSGNSVKGSGGQLQVRKDNTMFWGRYNTSNTPALPPVGLAAGNWLDSNDNRGMKWDIGGIGGFNALAFFVIDAADVGGKFSIKVGDTLFSDLASGAMLKNGNIYFLRLLLPETVNDLTVRLSHDINNDGFGIDGAIVGKVAPIPVPPAAALILTGFAALFGLRRRRTRIV